MKKSYIYYATVFIQILLVTLLIFKIRSEAFHLYAIIQVLSIFSTIAIAYSDDNPSIKISWIMTILLLPLLGILIYIVYGVGRFSQNKVKRMGTIADDSKRYEQGCIDFAENDWVAKKYIKQMKYINFQTSRPVYSETSATYFDSGEKMFDSLIEALNNAKTFIHLQYFIIAQGEMWQKIERILLEKVKNGVEVRVLYDYAGSMDFIDKKWHDRLESAGIKVGVFHKVGIFSNKLSNQRNHRKIVVIDGEVGFTGGINIGDEYINQKNRLGYWKDTGVIIKGNAVRSISLIFLNDWVYVTDEKIDYSKYLQTITPVDDKGYLQIFELNPGIHGNTARNILLNLINGAEKYLYITTPYLVIDQELITALCLAAKGGVDVRIIVPGTPDHKYVYIVSRSFFGELLKAGVKIYLYKPGFIHSKLVLSDGEIALLGSINFDFRSFYINYEIGAMLLYSDTITQIEQDFSHCMNESTIVDINEYTSRPIWTRLLEIILRLFAPLM